MPAEKQKTGGQKWAVNFPSRQPWQKPYQGPMNLKHLSISAPVKTAITKRFTIMFFTPALKRRMIQDTEHYLQTLKDMQAITPCQACDCFMDGYCEKFEASPPEAFYNQQCEHFIDGIPF